MTAPEEEEDVRSWNDIIRETGPEVVEAAFVRCVASFHEAGHAVVARLLSVEVTSVDMMGDDRRLAFVGFRSAGLMAEQAGDDRTAVARGLHADLMVAFAGTFAHVLAGFTDDCGDVDVADDVLNARIFAVKLARIEAGLPAMPGLDESGYLGPSDPLYPAVRVILERALKETITLLQDNWQAVERVARALVERDRLTSAELDRIIAHG